MKRRWFFSIFDDILLKSQVAAGNKLIIYGFRLPYGLAIIYGRVADKYCGLIGFGDLMNGSTSFTIFQPL